MKSTASVMGSAFKIQAECDPFSYCSYSGSYYSFRPQLLLGPKLPTAFPRVDCGIVSEMRPCSHNSLIDHSPPSRCVPVCHSSVLNCPMVSQSLRVKAKVWPWPTRPHPLRPPLPLLPASNLLPHHLPLPCSVLATLALLEFPWIHQICPVSRALQL